MNANNYTRVTLFFRNTRSSECWGITQNQKKHHIAAKQLEKPTADASALLARF